MVSSGPITIEIKEGMVTVARHVYEDTRTAFLDDWPKWVAEVLGRIEREATARYTRYGGLVSEARTRKTRPVASQNPNLPHWVMVHNTGRDGHPASFHFNLTPAAAEDLGRELIQVAATARAHNTGKEPQ